jgi:hydroxymethylpyrimidine/phosphomethylpyrimidine kinase
MGNVIPDRFFWALPPAEEGEEGNIEVEPAADDGAIKGATRRVH